jgi:hypothetical protein
LGTQPRCLSSSACMQAVLISQLIFRPCSQKRIHWRVFNGNKNPVAGIEDVFRCGGATGFRGVAKKRAPAPPNLSGTLSQRFGESIWVHLFGLLRKMIMSVEDAAHRLSSVRGRNPTVPIKLESKGPTEQKPTMMIRRKDSFRSGDLDPVVGPSPVGIWFGSN